MRLKPGDTVIDVSLPAIDGSTFHLNQQKGKRYLLSFFRFASCPFCNLRVYQLVQQYSEFGDNFTIVAVFDSTLDNLQEHAGKHDAPFPILSDGDYKSHQAYGIEMSMLGVLKGMFGRMPALLRAMFIKGYFPLKIKGRITAMPADFLVDENGIIQVAYYGQDEGDHMPFEQVKAFSLIQPK